MKMTTDKTARLLRQAALKIEAALGGLDMRNTPCSECGTRHWANLTHARLFQQLTDTPAKLRAAAERLTADTQSSTTTGAIARPSDRS